MTENLFDVVLFGVEQKNLQKSNRRYIVAHHTWFSSNTFSWSDARSVKITFSVDGLSIQFGTLTDELLDPCGRWLVAIPKFSSPSGSSRSVKFSRGSMEVSVRNVCFVIVLRWNATSYEYLYSTHSLHQDNHTLECMVWYLILEFLKSIPNTSMHKDS